MNVTYTDPRGLELFKPGDVVEVMGERYVVLQARSLTTLTLTDSRWLVEWYANLPALVKALAVYAAAACAWRLL